MFAKKIKARALGKVIMLQSFPPRIMSIVIVNIIDIIVCTCVYMYIYKYNIVHNGIIYIYILFIDFVVIVFYITHYIRYSVHVKYE